MKNLNKTAQITVDSSSDLNKICNSFIQNILELKDITLCTSLDSRTVNVSVSPSDSDDTSKPISFMFFVKSNHIESYILDILYSIMISTLMEDSCNYLIGKSVPTIEITSTSPTVPFSTARIEVIKQPVNTYKDLTIDISLVTEV